VKCYAQKKNQLNHPSFQERQMKSGVATSLKKGLKIIDVEKFLAYFFQ